jgi:hypothetical protein
MQCSQPCLACTAHRNWPIAAVADAVAAEQNRKGIPMGCGWVGYNITQLPYMYRPSGTPSFLYSTFSFALRKSACTCA